MQLNQNNGYIEPERLPQPVLPQEASAEATQQQQPTAPQQPVIDPNNIGLVGEVMVPIMDFIDDNFGGNQTTNEDSRLTYATNRAEGEAANAAQRESNPLAFAANEVNRAAANAGNDLFQAVATAGDLAVDAVGGGLDALGLVERDSSQIPWSESYEWANFDLGTAENQTVAGNIGTSIVSTVIGMAALGGAGVGVGASKTVGSRLASEALRGGLYDFFSDAGGGNLSNLVQLGPLANPLSKALAHQDEDNVWIRRIKNTLEGGTIGIAVDGLMELYGALRAGKAVKDAGGSPEDATKAAIAKAGEGRPLSPGKIENDANSGRPGLPEEGGKPALIDPQDRVFQGTKSTDTNDAAKSFWDDVEPGGGHSIVDEVDVQNLKSVDEVKSFISTRIPDVDVEDIARRLRRQPEEYTEKVFRSLAEFASTRNFEALEDLRFNNTFDIKGVDAGGAVVLDTLNKSLSDRVSILAKEVMELTELDAPFKVQANQIIDRAESMVLIRKEATQFSSQNLQNWKDVPNDLRRAVEKDRKAINDIFAELRSDLNSSDTMDIIRAKDRFAKLGIALATTKGDPVAQMGFWEALGHSGWNNFESVYINSMLSSPLSHARNIGGNAVAVAERSASRVLGNALTGNFTEAKRGLAAYDAFRSTMGEAFKIARESFSSPYSRVSAGAKISDRVASRRRELTNVVNNATDSNQKIAGQMALKAFDIFNSPWFSWPGKGLQAGDDFFKSILARTELRYQAALEADSIADGASAATRKQLRESTYQKLAYEKLSATGEILDHDLIKISEEATFQRELEGWSAGMATGLRAMPGGRIIVPFLKTGQNINRYAKELTPLMMLSKEYDQIMKNGTPDEKAIMNGRIALGSSVMGSAAFMAGADLITGVGPSPGPERDLWLKDHEPMSIKVGGKWVSYQALPGLSLLISTTADITQMFQKMGAGDIDYVLSAAPFFFTNAISSQPMFAGILDMSEILDFQTNYTPEKLGETIASIGNRLGGGEGLRRHMENAISQNMYDYKNWAVALLGKATGGILPSAYDYLTGTDTAKVPRIDVLTGKPMVSKYSNPLNSINPFTVVGKEVSPLVESFQSVDFPINLVVPDKVSGVKLTPEQKNFVAKEVYSEGEMAAEYKKTFAGKYFWNKYEQWRQDMSTGTALPKEQSDWYRILTRIQQKYKKRAVDELRKGNSDISNEFRENFAAEAAKQRPNAGGLSLTEQGAIREINDIARFYRGQQAQQP